MSVNIELNLLNENENILNENDERSELLDETVDNSHVDSVQYNEVQTNKWPADYKFLNETSDEEDDGDHTCLSTYIAKRRPDKCKNADEILLLRGDFEFAVKNWSIKEIEAILNNHPEINFFDEKKDDRDRNHYDGDDSRGGNDLEQHDCYTGDDQPVFDQTEHKADIENLSVCHLAALRPNGVLELLLKRGANKRSKTQFGVTPLHIAASRGIVRNVTALLDTSTDLQRPSGSASPQVSVEGLVDAKIEKPSSVKIITSYKPCDDYRIYTTVEYKYCIHYLVLIPGGTALHLASYYAHPACVRLLLQAGADPCAEDAFGRTPLDLAGECHVHYTIDTTSFEEVVSLLLQTNRYKTFKKGEGTWSPLHTAVSLNSVRALRLLVNAGMPVNWSAEYHDTPLHVSIEEKRADHFKILLKGKCDADHMKPVDITSMHTDKSPLLTRAILKDWPQGVHLALAAGASVTAKNKDNATPIHFAAGVGNEEILEAVINVIKNKIKNSLLINIRDNSNETPLSYAVTNWHTECVKRILKEKPVVTEVNQEGRHVYHTAAMFGHYEIFRMLYYYDETFVTDETPSIMEIAIKYGSMDVINMLLDKGAILSVELMTKIFNKAPNPREMIEKILDHNTTHNLTKEDPRCVVSLNFRVLSTPGKDEQMEILKTLISSGNRHGQKDLLAHPLVESFLDLKWKSMSILFALLLLLYGLFVLSLTCYIGAKFGYENDADVPIILKPTPWMVVLYLTAFIIILQEGFLLHVTEDVQRQFLEIESMVKLVSLGLSLILPLILSFTNKNESNWPRHMSSIALLVSWLEIMLLISRIPKLGLIVHMFGTVALIVIKILFTFIFLIIGFSLTFMLQFNFEAPFDNFWSALVKILVMSSSEFDYGNLIENKTQTNSENSTDEDDVGNRTISNQESLPDFTPSILAVQIIFAVFWLFIAIVLMNLMQSVAVNDLQSVQKLGNIMRLEKNVHFLGSLESLFHRNVIIRKITPENLITKSKVRTVMKLVPNNTSHENNKGLSSHLRLAVFERAISYSNLFKQNIKQKRTSNAETNENFEDMQNQFALMKQQFSEILTKTIDNLSMQIEENNYEYERKFEDIVKQIINDKKPIIQHNRKFKNAVRRIIEENKRQDENDKKIKKILDENKQSHIAQVELIINNKINNVVDQINRTNIQRFQQNTAMSKKFDDVVNLMGNLERKLDTVLQQNKNEVYLT